MFQGADRGRALGLLGTVIDVSTAAGPLLGGLLIPAVGTSEVWRWAFYVNVPTGAVVVLAASVAVNEFSGPQRNESSGPSELIEEAVSGYSGPTPAWVM